VVKCEQDCNSDELKRQYRAITRAVDKWVKMYGHCGRSLKCIEILKQSYFTGMNYEANYVILSSFVFDEYKKIRENGESV
jgi:transketolase N-terminal domain/subunit